MDYTGSRVDEAGPSAAVQVIGKILKFRLPIVVLNNVND